MPLLPPERSPLDDFALKHVDAVNQLEDFTAAVKSNRVADLDGVQDRYEEQRPKSLESNLKSAFQKVQAFKAAVELASDEVTAHTECDKGYFKRIIVSPEALVSRLKGHLQFQIRELEALVGKEERGFARSKNKSCDATVQSEYTDELNQQALTQLPTLSYYSGEAGSEVAERNTLVDTYERLRKDLIAEGDFEAQVSTAAFSSKVKRATASLEASKVSLLEKLKADFEDQVELLENAFQKIENGDSLNTEVLNELIGHLNASSIQAQKAASLKYHLRFKAFSKYVVLQQEKSKKAKKGSEKQFLKNVTQFATLLGFDDDLRVFETELSEETIWDVISYVEKALVNNVFEISDELAQELDSTAEDLSSKLHKGVTKKLSKSQSQFDDVVQKKVTELLKGNQRLDVKQLADVEHHCEEVADHYKIKNTALFVEYKAKKDAVEEVLSSLQGADPAFFQGFKDALAKKDNAVQAFEAKLADVNTQLDAALGNTSGEHTFASVDQKLRALSDLIEEKHAAITQKRDAKRALKTHLKKARDLTEVTNSEDVKALFKAQLNYDLAGTREKLQSAVYKAEAALNPLNSDAILKAREVVGAGPEETADDLDHVANLKEAHFAAVTGQDRAKVTLKRAQEALASFDTTNQKLGELITEAYARYQDLSDATASLLAQSHKQDVMFDGAIGEFTQALEGLRLETEAVAPVFAKGIQRKLAQLKAETVGAELLVLARENAHFQSDRAILGSIEAAHVGFQRNKQETSNEHLLQAKSAEEYFDVSRASSSLVLAQSSEELRALQEDLSELDGCLANLQGNNSLSAITEEARLTHRKAETEAGIKVKTAEIEALKGCLERVGKGRPKALEHLALRAEELTEELDMKLDNVLFQASVQRTEIDLRERDVVQLQSQLSAAKDVDLREASLKTQEELSKIPPLETLGVDNPSVKLWATGVHRVEGVIAAIPSVVLKEEVPLADLEETVSVLQEREESLIVTAQVTGRALDQAVDEFNKAKGTEKAEFEKAISVLEERAKAVLISVQVTSEALNQAKREALAVKDEVAAKFEEVLAQAEARGLFSLKEENALVPYELIVPVLLQELGNDFFVDYTDQEIAAFVVKAVNSLSQKLGFDEAKFEQIVTAQKAIQLEVTQLEDKLKELAAEQKRTIQAIKQARKDSEINLSDIEANKEKIVQLNALKAFLESNHNCCSTIESRKVQLAVTLSALNAAKADLGVGALEEAEEAVSVLEDRVKSNPLTENRLIRSAIEEAKANEDGVALEEVLDIIKPLEQLLRESTLSPEKEEEARVKLLVTSSALEKAKVYLKACREKAETIRVLQARHDEVAKELGQDRKVFDPVLARFIEVFGKSLVSSPLFLERPFTDAKLKACVERALDETQGLIPNLQKEVADYGEVSFNSRTKLREIEDSTARIAKKMDAAINKFEGLKEAKKESSTLKAKAYNFAFQFFGLPLSVGKALKLFCTTEDEKDIDYVRITHSILKNRKSSAEPVEVSFSAPRKRKVHFDKKREVQAAPRKKSRAEGANGSDRRDAKWLMNQLGLVSRPLPAES